MVYLHGCLDIVHMNSLAWFHIFRTVYSFSTSKLPLLHGYVPLLLPKVTKSLLLTLTTGL